MKENEALDEALDDLKQLVDTLALEMDNIHTSIESITCEIDNIQKYLFEEKMKSNT